MRRLAIIGFIVAFTSIVAAWRQPAASGEKKIGDLGPQLPRIAPKEPKDAVKTFAIAPGFRIELVASEPLIRSPVALDFDEDGRLYVAEYPEYNLHNDATFKEKGAIKRLEDTDGDGVYDKATTYAADLPAPTAVACWNGGVFVGSVPHLLYFKDKDGDGRADERRVVFAGFERDRAGEAMLNSIRWGLDNRFHLSTSLAGGQIRPGEQPKSDPVSVRSRFLIFDPRTGRFETTTGAGQHGMSMDDWGRTFVCDNSNPIHHVFYDGRYAVRNPFAIAPPVAANIYDRLAEPNLLRTSSFEPWRVVRTKLRVAGLVKGPTEGGRVGGHFTAATGVTVYRGDAYPEPLRGQAFVGDVSNNIIHRMMLTPKGVGFVASRADQGREFLASSDNWFRPCQFAHGPDGCLYIADIYRELIETTESIPSEILKHLHPRSGFERGRIWRIVPEGQGGRPAPRLGKASTAELVALLDHANGWHRDTAARLLYQRQNAAAPLLAKLCRAAKTPQGRMHALYALDGLDALTDALVLDGLVDRDARVREHVLRLSERFVDRPAIQKKWAALVADSDLRVRWQLAFSVGAAADANGTDVLLRIAAGDAADPWFRFAILTSAKDRTGPLVRELVREPATRAMPHVQILLKDLASSIGLSRRDDDIAALLQAIESLPASDAALGRDMTAALLLKLPPASRAKLQSAPLATVLKDLLADARRTVLDQKRPSADRAAAARNLRLGTFADGQALYAQFLDPREPEDVQKAILDALGNYEEPAATTLILDAWATFSPGVRAAAAETVLSRPKSIGLLFDALESGKIKTSEMDPARMAILRTTVDASLKSRADKLFAGAALSKRSDVIAAYKGALDRAGDVDRGRLLFRKHCALCHRLENTGEQIGASLSGIRERGPEFLLVNILDPNREVLPKFLSYQAQTDGGRTVTGIIQNETATSVTLRRLDGTSETISRANLESLRTTGVSYMPEGFEKHLSLAEMADLIAYLLATP
jgi:putative membrane-bound dehydrogenase-like protein